jgi:hypothetical protein
MKDCKLKCNGLQQGRDLRVARRFESAGICLRIVFKQKSLKSMCFSILLSAMCGKGLESNLDCQKHIPPSCPRSYALWYSTPKRDPVTLIY